MSEPAPRPCDRRALWLAIALALATSLAGIGSHSLWTPDEPRDAAIGLGMLRHGDWVIPRLSGEPFLEKPPLTWWAQAASYAIFGPTDAAARVPSALFGAAALLVAFALGRRLAGDGGGLLALGALATTVEFSEVTHRAIVDPALVFFVALAHLGAVLALHPRDEGERRRGLATLSVALPFTLLAKGIVGPALAVGPPVLWIAARWLGEGRRPREVDVVLRAALVALPVFLVVAAPWAIALVRAGGWSALNETLIVNTFGRLASSDDRSFGHHQPGWYYLVYGPGHLAPWIVALPAMLEAGVLARDDDDAPPRRLLFATAALGFLLLSLPSGKRGIYLVPLFPALAATVGWWLATVPRGPVPRYDARALDRPTLLVLLGAAAAAPAIVFAAALAVRVAPLRAPDLAPIRAHLGAGDLALLGAFAAAWTLALGRALLRGLRSREAPAPALVVGALVILAVVAQTVVKAAVDPAKDLHGVTAAIVEVVPRGEPLVLFEPDETIRGIVAFDLDAPTRLAFTPAELAPALEGARFVIYEERRAGEVPEAVRSRLAVVRAGVGPPSRAYDIAEVR